MRRIDPTTRMVNVDGKQYAMTKKDCDFFVKLVEAYTSIVMAEPDRLIQEACNGR